MTNLILSLWNIGSKSKTDAGLNKRKLALFDINKIVSLKKSKNDNITSSIGFGGKNQKLILVKGNTKENIEVKTGFIIIDNRLILNDEK